MALIRSVARDYFLRFASKFSSFQPGIVILNGHFSGRIGPHSGRLAFSRFLSQIENFGDLVDFDRAVEQIVQNPQNNSTLKIALSFDDGFSECFHDIFPVLRERSLKAAFFLNSRTVFGSGSSIREVQGRLGVFDRDFLDPHMVEEMANDGQIIGSHSYQHFRLSDLSEEKFRYEILRDKELLEGLIDRALEYFAWPFGGEGDVSPSQVSFLRTKFSYLFSSTPTPSNFLFAGKVINRRHLEPNSPVAHIKYFLQQRRVHAPG